LDISRGDMLSSAQAPATLLKNFSADVCWLSEEPLDLGRKYWLKHTTRQVAAKVTGIDSLLNINTQQAEAGSELKLNGIARIQLTVQQPLAADSYDAMRSTGSFILIDEISHQTVAAGMIRLA
jgi:sulfate adenylyltransferase subunit 1